MRSLENHIQKKLDASADFDFQSLQMIVGRGGKILLQKTWGKPYRYFDIASLTKVVFTTLWFMEAFQCDKKILQNRVADYLPWYPHRQVKVLQLLSHNAGNEWWQPFYKEISRNLSPEQAYQQMEKNCQQATLTKSKQPVYSDLDFYLLGSIMQKVEGTPLIRVWNRLKNKFYPDSRFHFNYQNKSHFPKEQYAPTEDCPWRGRVLRGEVHDENCWALGGIAPHAGLFAELSDLGRYGRLLREIARGQNSHISPSAIATFQKRQFPVGRGDWGIGFMKPAQQGSSAGERFSKKSFGHTGFTGTSFWFDPTRDLFIGLLSNRVHPSRDNKGFQRLRPQLHDWTVEFLEDNK